MLFGLLSGREEQVVELMPPAALYTQSTIGYGLRDRDVATTILGLPGPSAEHAAAHSPEALVLAMMNDAVRPMLRARFTSTPGPEARAGYRIVISLAASRGDAIGLCARAVSAGSVPMASPFAPDAESWFYADAAFCVSGTTLTAVSGRIKGVTGVDDARLRRLVGAVTRALFPTPDTGS